MKKIVLCLLISAAFSTIRAATNTFTENFTANPATTGWQIFGDTNLFEWNPTTHQLIVTWDSSQPNSYFYHPLPSVLGLQDGFRLSFDLTLNNAVAGGDFGFELAIGLFNLADATNADFIRGTGFQSPNLIEFDYFPPLAPFGASIDATMADDSNDFNFLFDDTLGLTNGVTYNIAFSHTPGAPLITAAISTYDTNHQLQLVTTLPFNFVEGAFTDFFVDTLSISSYNDENADGSIFATGSVGNIVMTSETRPVGNIIGANTDAGTWQTQFTSRMNWTYTLERSADLRTWVTASSPAAGTGTYLMLQDTNEPDGRAFYRVQASQ